MYRSKSLCVNSENGAIVNLPQVAWRDNATMPGLLQQRLIVNQERVKPFTAPTMETPLVGEFQTSSNSVAGSPHTLRFQATDQSERTGSVDIRG